MATFTLHEVNSQMTHFNNTSVAGDTVVNNTSGVLQLCLAITETSDTGVVKDNPDLDSIITIGIGETGTLADGDYYILNQGSAMYGTVPSYLNIVT